MHTHGGRTLGLTIAAGLALAVISPATAADLPARPVYKAPPAATATGHDWRGFYVGGHLGYGWGDGSTAAVDPASLLALFPAAPAINFATSTATAPFDLSAHPSGAFGGLQAGYNWQAGRLVYGVEADVSFGKIKDEATGNYAFRAVFLIGDFDNYVGTVRLNQEIDYFGTLRGRLGLSEGPWLLYATGGLAWARVKTSLESSHARLTNSFPIPGFPAALDGHASSSAIQWGYALGGGGEWAFARQWSLKGEYLYMNVGDGPRLSIPGTTIADTDIAIHTARLGVNYRFGGP